jgi:hypothetical protein
MVQKQIYILIRQLHLPTVGYQTNWLLLGTKDLDRLKY